MSAQHVVFKGRGTTRGTIGFADFAQRCGYGGDSLCMPEFTAIQMLTPVLVTLLAAWLLKERVRPARWVLVGLAFAGALVVIRPGSGLFGWAVVFPLVDPDGDVEVPFGAGRGQATDERSGDIDARRPHPFPQLVVLARPRRGRGGPGRVVGLDHLAAFERYPGGGDLGHRLAGADLVLGTHGVSEDDAVLAPWESRVLRATTARS